MYSDMNPDDVSPIGSSGRARARAAFTLVELLVVIGTIAVLVGVLLPALGRARGAARAIQCNSMLRQYMLAYKMYLNESHDVAVDANKYLDYGHGLAGYLGQKAGVGRPFTRCLADDDARLGTVGGYASTAPTAVLDGSEATDNQVRTRDGTVYSPVVSIGVNPAAFSDSRHTTGKTTPTLAALWLKPATFRLASGQGNNSTPYAAFDPQIYARLRVRPIQRFHGAMAKDRSYGGIDTCKNPLRLAERIAETARKPGLRPRYAATRNRCRRRPREMVPIDKSAGRNVDSVMNVSQRTGSNGAQVGSGSTL